MKKTTNIIFDIRLLLALGIFSACMATLSRGDDKSFNLWSTTSAGLIGASIGILKESSDDKDKNDTPSHYIGSEDEKY